METKVIGAAPEADIRIDHPRVSSRHAQFSVRGGYYVLEDLGSSNGTFVDGQRITSAAVTPQSQIRIGPVELQFSALVGNPAGTTTQKRTSGPRGAQTEPATSHTVGAEMLTIGRDSTCDLCVNDDRVSARHARVMINCGRLIVEDAGSVKGTWVNGKPVSWKILTPEDVVTVGSRSFRFRRAERSDQDAPGARVDLRGICVDVVDRESHNTLRIIDDVSFTALPGEIVGVMGASGSGKTTLLYALAGISPPTHGQVLVDGRVLEENGASHLGFAPQDDIVHALLTVEEAVRYSARLRCPVGTPSGEIERRTQRAISDVGLTEKRKTRIGSVTSKSLSGGQRKRVSIAMELVADPALLLLDEPTSGLSASDAADLLLLLRQLANRGRTIILTIHQPSYEMYVQMDQVAILDAGRLVYFGPTAIESFDFFDVRERSAEAVFRGLESGTDAEARRQRFRSSDLYTRFVDGRARTLEQSIAAKPPTAPAALPGPLAVLGLLVHRGLLLKTRDNFFWVIAMVVPLLASAMIAVVLKTQLQGTEWTTIHAGVEHTYLVVLTIMVCFFGALSSSLEIVGERAVFGRERRGGVGVAPYISSKAFLYAIPAVMHPAISLGVFALFGDALEGNYFGYLVVLVPAFFAAACAGLCLSAAIRSAEGVIGLAVAYAIVQTVFSAFAPLHAAVGDDVSDEWMNWVSAPITARWTLSGLASQSDICEAEGTETTLRLGPQEIATFPQSCRQNYYHFHGIWPNDSAEQRLDSKYLRYATLANGMLAVIALAGAAALTARRNSR